MYKRQLQPSLASQGVKGTVTNALASAFVGSLGGGKSFCNNLLVYYSVDVYKRQECAFPKRFDCMKIVRKYLSFKELKSCIKKEQFNKFEFNDKSDSFSFYYSENWLFVRDVYIPCLLYTSIVGQ